MFNISLKYFVALPVAILFISATNPSEFAASLNSIGVSYKVGYSVAIALRYIPDIQRDYHSISQAQQARGVELGRSEPFFKRLEKRCQHPAAADFDEPEPHRHDLQRDGAARLR